jgi:8-oxo-dGTP pyrophosphatase MutT (NUDIX family)
MRLKAFTPTLLAQLEAYVAYDATEAEHLARTLQFLRTQPNPFARATAEGHMTASAVLIDDSGQQVALILHEKLGRWFQPGGHCEPEDYTLPLAALRELSEETGIPQASITLLQETPFDIDVHLIPARGDELAHWHYDVRYLFQTQAILLPESPQCQWRAITTVRADSDPSRWRFAVKLLALR